MFEKVNRTQTEEIEKHEVDNALELLSDDELENEARHFLGEEITSLTQKEIEIKITPLLTELAKRGISGFGLFSFALPDKVTAEELQSGNSSWAKVYKSLFGLSKTEGYKQSPELQTMVRELENIIDQNPQMMGPVAMWDTAKDVMWRRDIPSHAKGSLMGSMTYALAFFDTDRYEAELLKNLDFENTENYAEVAHMLEALKQFWSSGHESYAEDRVPDFYLNALRKIKETPNANYLLSVRAREILSMIEQSEDFPVEARDLKPFELSKGMYASTQVGEGITVVPEDANADVSKAIEEFDANEEQITPPQWMVDEAIANGESWVSWQPPQDLMRNREHLFNDIHQYATVPIDEQFGDFPNLEAGKKDEMMFDYEYLVSRPVREMIQREFDFELKDLSVKEQFYFLNYLKRVTVENADVMKRFTSLYGVDGMRTFLSLERGDESLGNNIVAFGQHDEVAGTVFKYYGELLNSAERAEALVKEVSDCEGEACTDLANQVSENIVNRAQKDLEKAVRAHDPSEVAAQIENYVAAAKEYVALLQEIGTGEIEEVNSSELSTEEQDRMKVLMKANYDKAYPEPENEDFKTAVAGSLEKSFSNPDTSFRVLRDNGKIVSYNRFDTVRDLTGKEVSYFGSFNADPAYSGVGGVMLEETIKDQLETGRPMMAHCDPTQAITRKYIEDGFVATGLYELADKPSFEIWRSKDSSAQLESKKLSVNELLESIDQSGAMTVREQSESEAYPELQNGMGLTRYFTHEGKTYLVFETLPDTLSKDFTPPQEEQKEAA
jgi:hypothetical protein